MTKRLNLVLLVLIVAIGGPFYWYNIDNRHGDVAAQPLHIHQLRALANALPGQQATGVAAERVALIYRRSNWVAAGSGLYSRPLSVIAFRLAVPGTGPVLIDTGTTPAIARARKLDEFIPRRQAAVDAAVGRASLILATGTSAVHLGGLSGPSASAALGKVALSSGQIAAVKADETFTWAETAGLKPAWPGSDPHAVAPGIVAIPTGVPHSGSQMLYVRLADGREYLFTGEVAPLTVSWRETRAPSRLRATWYGHDTRKQIYAWLLTIARLHDEAPNLKVVPGRDFGYIVANEDKHGIAREFPGEFPGEAQGQHPAGN